MSDVGIVDWRTAPLAGRVLIEASAGTGKTYTIGLIYLRLLLERGLRVEQIMVATFTERAAQELRDRLRARLIEAEHMLTNSEAAGDATLSSWLARWRVDEATLAAALRRIRLARADLDRAPIGTIHALCQHILRDHPIDSGSSLLPEKIADEKALVRECIEDFWRRRYLARGADAGEVEAVAEKGIDGFVNDIHGLLNGDARVLPLDAAGQTERDIATLRETTHIALLRTFSADKSLYAPKKTQLLSRFGEFADLLEQGGDLLDAIVSSKAACFDADVFVTFLSDKGHGVLVGHVVVECLQRLRVSAKSRDREARARALADALAFCREEIPRRACERDVQTFSMLIDNVRARLRGPHASRVFADALFAAYPAALIDEFQDTDGRQFDIFDAIYRERSGETRGLLAMIGDPKQAIYGFRGGDLASYLRARRSADGGFPLTVNQRSSTPLVSAVNTLYANTQGGFDDAEIRYVPIVASGKVDATPFTRDGAVIPRPLAIHRFGCDDDKNWGDLDNRVTEDCVERIVELLNDQTVAIGSRRLMPGDIAVLTRTNGQIDRLRRRLVARGVPCVGSGRGSVFDSDIARDLELVLYGVLHATDERAVRGALSTRLLGATLRTVQSWQDDERLFEQELERFAAWHALARSRGVQSLIQTLIAENAGRLLAASDGERVVTDLRHLGESLGSDDDAQRGLESAYTRLASLRRNDGDDDVQTGNARQLRIESDAARVQLMTVHGAKGLQFPIVFLPFAGRVSDRSGPRAPKILRFHDADGIATVDLGTRDFTQNLSAHLREELQEELRLLYVGLTRAEYAVHLYWSERCKPDFGVGAGKTSALDVVIRQTLERLGLPPTEASLGAMAEQCEGIDIVDPATVTNTRYIAADESDEPRHARSPLPAVRAFRWLHSFSSLAKHAPLTTSESGAADEIETDVEAEREDAAQDDNASADDPMLLAIDAWRGRHFGNALHEILENAGSEPVWPQRRDFLAQHLLALRVKTPPGADACEPIGRLVDRVRSADLGDGLRLIEVPETSRISEFEFQLPVEGVSLDTLRELCLQHSAEEAISPALSSARLSGMLTGFADLIFEYAGRYHVLDYKTNWLGTRLRDYAGDNLVAAMRDHHYPLQALIYTIALHRYLRGRLDGYTPERHLGDSWYLFVRAVGLGDGLGVWRRGWPAALIEALDEALAGAPA